ncbi:MAG: glycosyltransferase family 2 protein [Deltaproteobacteria bacterium HGW-Deltaproteobacteria-4]|nr:MAG: glycosyltransferase family 2 protein [Deltaproteobacteria bacterium HGW-Deltaproteobacteria-4]
MKKSGHASQRNFMIDILLATYNGGAWLDEQIDSLLAQDFLDWRLLVRDDGSTDNTVAILKAWQSRLGDQLIILADDGKNLGPGGNFARLLEASTADYIMFCDQDDVWLPGKVSLTLAKMHELEEIHGAETSLLVHTDVRVVDESLNVVADSGDRYRRIDPEKGNAFSRLLLQNISTGCTVMLNRTLRDLALPIPGAAFMHDHWLSLVASCFGDIAYLPTPTLLYRQHVKNKVGAQVWNLAHVVRLLFRLPTIRQMMVGNRMQASAFYECYHAILQDRDRELLEAFIHMPEHGLLQKRRNIFKYGFFYAGAIRNIGWLVLC